VLQYILFVVIGFKVFFCLFLFSLENIALEYGDFWRPLFSKIQSDIVSSTLNSQAFWVPITKEKKASQ